MNNLFRYNLYLYLYLVRVSNTDTIDRVWPVNLLVAPSHSIAIVSSISRPLAIVVDTIAIRSMVVRTALVDKRAGTSIISWLSRSLAIITSISITSITITTIACKTLSGSVCVTSGISWLSISGPLAIITTISITSIVSMNTLGASVVVADSMTISWLSRPLAISISSIAISSIVSMQTLRASVCVAYGMAITISRLSISGPLAISMSNIVSVGVLGRVVSISMVSLGDIDRSSTISMTIAISRFSLSRSLTISMISIPTMKTLRTPVCVATATIRMVGNTSIAIARLSSYYCGKGCNYCYNLSCHGYKCTKLS